MIRTTIYLPDELHEDLRKKAFQGRTSMSKLIISSLSDENYIKQHPIAVKGSGVRNQPSKECEAPDSSTTFYKKAGEIKGDDYI